MTDRKEASTASTPADGDKSKDRLQKARTLLIRTLWVLVVALPLQWFIQPLAFVVLIGFLMSQLATVRYCSAIGVGPLPRTGLIFLMFVPLLNLALLLHMNNQLVKQLRKLGYTVYFFGEPYIPQKPRRE